MILVPKGVRVRVLHVLWFDPSKAVKMLSIIKYNIPFKQAEEWEFEDLLEIGKIQRSLPYPNAKNAWEDAEIMYLQSLIMNSL